MGQLPVIRHPVTHGRKLKKKGTDLKNLEVIDIFFNCRIKKTQNISVSCDCTQGSSQIPALGLLTNSTSAATSNSACYKTQIVQIPVLNSQLYF